MWPVSTGTSPRPALTFSARTPPAPRGGLLLADAGLPDPWFPQWGWAGVFRGRPPGSQTPNSDVAGTTEKIFEEKRELYDVYVDNQNVKTHHDHLQPLLKINSADREKYRRLNEQRWGTGGGAEGRGEGSWGGAGPRPARGAPGVCP